MGERLLVVGGDPAGMAAAIQARTDGPHLEIVALVPGAWPGYDAGGIGGLLRGTLRSPSQLVAPGPDRLRAMRIDLRTDHRLVGIDLDRRSAEVRNVVHGRTFRLGFDSLHLATGTRARRAEWPGADSPNVHTAGSLEEADHFTTEIAERKASHLVVVGSGFRAVSMAAALAQRGLSVTLLARGEGLEVDLDDDMAAMLSKELRAVGVDLRTGAEVAEVDDSSVYTSEGTVPADLVLLAGEEEPVVSVAQAGGIALGPTGALKVDRQQRTSAEGVWAAGGCAEATHLLCGEVAAQAVTADSTGPAVGARQGRVAGINIAGGYATFPGVLATVVSRVGSLGFGRTGLSSVQADLAGFAHVSATASASPAGVAAATGYGVEGNWARLRLLAERRTGALLGAQVASERAMASELNVAAAAIAAHLDVEALAAMDLASSGVDAPPLLQEAARQLFDSLR